MVRFLLTRILLAIVTVWAVCTITFFVASFAPGDPVALAAGQHSDPATLARVRHELGLDLPPGIRYLHYLNNTVHGDLGKTFQDHLPVRDVIAREIPVTAQLALAAIVTALVIGIIVGILASLRPNSFGDRLLTTSLLAGVSVPNFVLGPLLIILVPKVGLDIPTTGWGEAANFLLPTLVLAARPAALIGRMTRSSMIETLAQDYIRTARAKGLAPGRILFRHALKNALLPVLTTAGVSFGYLLSGSFVVETVFRVPGVGFDSIQSLTARDYPLIQGTTLVFATMFVLVNLVVDLLYTFLDPRVRIAGAKA
jgi:peptide/nickel transport system permease protein